MSNNNNKRTRSEPDCHGDDDGRSEENLVSTLLQQLSVKMDAGSAQMSDNVESINDIDAKLTGKIYNLEVASVNKSTMLKMKPRNV